MAAQVRRDSSADRENFKSYNGRREAGISRHHLYADGESYEWYVLLTAKIGRRTTTRAYHTVTKTDARQLAKDWIAR